MFDNLTNYIIDLLKQALSVKENKYKLAVLLDLCFILLVFYFGFNGKALSSFISHISFQKQRAEVFGFAPYWTFDKLDKVDFSTLTTLSYFGITVNSDGSFEKDDPGYQTFESDQATALFKKAHSFGTRVVLTLTQMEADPLMAFLDDKKAQNTAISNAIAAVKSRNIDGVNLDFEYISDPGQEYRDKYSLFVKNMTTRMHQSVPNAYVTVSVLASSMKDPKIYDIKSLGNSTDGVFMMAYDFAVTGSENAMPTSPLYGYKQGTYWYDVSTAVEDFLKVMPSNKLILGLPWYGYNYSVYNPAVKAQTTWYGGTAQMYGNAQTDIVASNPQIENIKTGWDNVGQVGWKAYYDDYAGTWRMIFLDDPKSLSLKYDFAKKENLGGVGIWALGFEDGRKEMWTALKSEFGTKIADNRSFVEKAYANSY